jgi:hypothetical protein
MELQKGNVWAAVRLLERCVTLDPANSPVLNWKPVSVARASVLQCRGRRACLVAAGASASGASSSAGAGMSSNGAAASSAAGGGGGARRRGGCDGL